MTRVPTPAQTVDEMRRSDRPAYLRHMAGGRDLEREKRAGVLHFVTGQHHAKIYPWAEDAFTHEPIQVGRLTYVDVGGHLVVLLTARSSESDPWRVTWVSRHGQETDEPCRRVSEGEITLSAKMLDALSRAELTEL